MGAVKCDLNWSFGTERVALRCFLPPALVEKNSYEFGHDQVGNETVGMQTLNVAYTARD